MLTDVRTLNFLIVLLEIKWMVNMYVCVCIIIRVYMYYVDIYVLSFHFLIYHDGKLFLTFFLINFTTLSSFILC